MLSVSRFSTTITAFLFPFVLLTGYNPLFALESSEQDPQIRLAQEDLALDMLEASNSEPVRAALSSEKSYSTPCSIPSKLRASAQVSSERRQALSLDYIFPMYLSSEQDTLIFLNPKGTTFFPKGDEINLGLGFRKAFLDKFILGIHFFYDKKYSPNRVWHSQLGYGFEFLSEPFDFRFNYYNPITKAKVVRDDYFLGETSLLYWQMKEESLPGFDFEFGVPLLPNILHSRIYAGGFDFNSKLSKDVRGARLRTETDFNKWLSMDLTVNSRNKQETEFIGDIRLNLPLELCRVICPKRLEIQSERSYIQERMFERIVRDIDVQTSSPIIIKKAEGTVVDDIIYVDNTNTTGTEDGSLTHPYSTLGGAFGSPRYQAGSTIYVFKGDGTSTGYTGSFTLADNVVFWGSGSDGGFSGVSVLGYPVINGDGAWEVLTLADNNTVMGLQIEGGRFGILGEGIAGTCTIKQNNITSNTARGINISTSNLSAVISGNTFSHNDNGAIEIDADNGPGTVTAAISDNTITDCADGIGILTYLASNVSADISGNTITNSGGGIFLGGFESSTLSATISRNTISNGPNEGIFLWSTDDNVLSAKISENTITGKGTEGVYVYDLDAGSIDPVIDLGGGALGSIGRNSIYGNTSYDVSSDVAGLAIKAQNNWWGQSPPDAGQFNGDVDYGSWLTSAP
ncbi:MAG: NosD domain-containing protein [Deltaproteobacteria bacterium]